VLISISKKSSDSSSYHQTPNQNYSPAGLILSSNRAIFESSSLQPRWKPSSYFLPDLLKSTIFFALRPAFGRQESLMLLCFPQCTPGDSSLALRDDRMSMQQVTQQSASPFSRVRGVSSLIDPYFFSELKAEVSTRS
jgi:hypothetical protein